MSKQRAPDHEVQVTSWSVLASRDDATGHKNLLIEVVAGAHPVIPIGDPQWLALDEQHRGSTELDHFEVGGHLGIVGCQERETGCTQDVLGRKMTEGLLLFQGFP
jgi:hypothetical protein